VHTHFTFKQSLSHTWLLYDRIKPCMDGCAFITTATAIYNLGHCRQSGLPCCHCSHLEQSASTHHVRTLYVCFPRTLECFSLQAFLSMTRYLNFCSACTVTVVIFGHLNRSFFYLLVAHPSAAEW